MTQRFSEELVSKLPDIGVISFGDKVKVYTVKDMVGDYAPKLT